MTHPLRLAFRPSLYERGRLARGVVLAYLVLIVLAGAKHLLVGEKYVRRVLEEITASALGMESVELPTDVPQL